MHWRATSRKSYEFESRSGEVYSVQHYVIKFVSNRSVACSRYSVSSTYETDSHDIAELLFKVALNTITLPL